jgi:hypothetical protein
MIDRYSIIEQFFVNLSLLNIKLKAFLADELLSKNIDYGRVAYTLVGSTPHNA